MKKPKVFKTAKQAIKHGERLMAIDDQLSSNGDGFLVVVPPHCLLDAEGQRWTAQCNDEKLWLERYEDGEEVA